MTLRKTLGFAIAALLLVTAAAVAVNSHEGKISSIDPAAKMIVVEGKDGNQWNVYWAETTKFKDIVPGELKVGDTIRFESVTREGKTFATQLWREEKASESD